MHTALFSIQNHYTQPRPHITTANKADWKPKSKLLSPQSQSFSRSYGSNLPTSLTYIILLTRGYSPWRPDAVMSTNTTKSTFISIFKDFCRCTGTLTKTEDLYQIPNLIANWVYSKLWPFVNKKRKLLPGETKMAPNTRSLPRNHTFSSGMLTWFPFDVFWHTSKFKSISLSLRTD